MYETEANSKVESASQIPADAMAALAASAAAVRSRTLIPWSEHCDECVWPTCYTSCELYQAREDLRCRRFVDGMVRINCRECLNGYVLKIRFKRWGKLFATSALKMHSLEAAKRIASRDYLIGTTLHRSVMPARLKQRLTESRYNYKKRQASQINGSGGEMPSCFLLECFNPQEELVRLTMTIRPVKSSSGVFFQNMMLLPPGFSRVRTPVEQIMERVDLREPFTIELTPNATQDGLTLYFGIADFVREAPSREPVKPVKCVVWDLDNTLWDGILLEDGAEKLTLKPGAAEIIAELDRRGILNSVVSRNDAEEALEVIRKFGLEEYFLYPQISHNPKSEGIKAIADSLNISTDALLFIDDSTFELEQVRSMYPEVRIMPAERYLSLPHDDACYVPVTAESAARRRMYRVESQRREAAQGHGSDYTAFLRDCDIRLRISPLSERNIQRVHELTQRVNQMNFSGNRYDKGVLRSILAQSTIDSYVLECEDRFGSYGIIGFSLVDRTEPRMIDLMFSCRIASKRVEHAFLAHLIRTYAGGGSADFYADYRKTPRNEVAGRVFKDIGMDVVSERDGLTSLVFPKHRVPPDDGLIRIVTPGEPREHVPQ